MFCIQLLALVSLSGQEVSLLYVPDYLTAVLLLGYNRKGKPEPHKEMLYTKQSDTLTDQSAN